MRVTVLCDGRARPPFDAASAMYERRLGAFCDLAVREVNGPDRLASAIAELSPGIRVVALDARGDQHTSEALAAWLGPRRSDPLALVLGGADGLPAAVLARARERWSLGPGTLPHQLARVVALEQLYRAFTILGGHPYHHGG